jgi:non-specific serine/threonine protein kinase
VLAPAPAAAAGPASPREACGTRVFIALAMCMDKQCESPQFRSHPQCTQWRAEQKEMRERNQAPMP